MSKEERVKGSQPKETSPLPITRLAAAHAALDPDRRGWRGDILVSASLEILTTQDGLSSRDLARLINHLWGSTSVTEDLVAASLAIAERAHLVKRLADGKWLISEDARREAEEDRAWADSILAEAYEEFRKRLTDCCETAIKDERFPKLFDQLLVALTAGAEGVYEATVESATPEQLRPIRFDLKRIGERISQEIQPKSVARAMLELCVAAADPADEFANEIIRLVVGGNILQGLLSGAMSRSPWISRACERCLTRALLFT